MYSLNYRTKNFITDGFNKITSYTLISIRLTNVKMKRHVKACFIAGTDDSFYCRYNYMVYNESLLGKCYEV